MKRDKFFYVSPALFPDWPFKTRYAIGVKLSDFRARNKKVFRFLIKGKMYSISRNTAFKYGLKYMLPNGTLPNLIPLDLFTKEKYPPETKELPLQQNLFYGKSI